MGFERGASEVITKRSCSYAGSWFPYSASVIDDHAGDPRPRSGTRCVFVCSLAPWPLLLPVIDPRMFTRRRLIIDVYRWGTLVLIAGTDSLTIAVRQWALCARALRFKIHVLAGQIIAMQGWALRLSALDERP